LDFTPQYHELKADTNFVLMLDLLQAGAEFESIAWSKFAHLFTEPNPLLAFADMIINKKEFADPKFGWLHVQTLSYHIGGLYWDLGEREILEKLSGGPVAPKIHLQGSPTMYQSGRFAMFFRLAWIREFMNHCLSDYGGMQKYYDHAKASLKYVTEYYLFTDKMVAEVADRIHSVLWAENEALQCPTTADPVQS
jgi:hypothetical protein